MDSNNIKNLTYSLGADVCAIGSIDRFKEAPKGFHPLDIYPEAKSVISIGKHFSASLLDANTKVPFTLNHKAIRQSPFHQMNHMNIGILKINMVEEYYH